MPACRMCRKNIIIRDEDAKRENYICERCRFKAMLRNRLKIFKKG